LFSDIDIFVKNLSLLLLLFICVIYVLALKNNKSKALRFFTYYMLSIALVMLYSVYLARNKLPNLYLSHFYFWFQFIFLSLFYRSLFVSKLQKLIVSSFVFIAICFLLIQYSVYPELFNKFNLPEIVVCSFPLIIYSIIHFYNLLTRKNRYIYINIGILLYIALSTLIFVLGDYLAVIETKSQVVKNIWFVNKILYLAYLILVVMEWYKNLRMSKKLLYAK